MAMKRGTTPTITITVDGMTFQGMKLYVTIEDSAGTQITKDSNGGEITKTVIYDDSGNPTGCTVTMYLSQDETLGFDIGTAQAQLTWIDAYGVVGKTDIFNLKFDRTLLEEVVHYG